MASNTETVGLGLNEQLCFALYAASRATTGRYRSLLEPLGLTYPQYLVMLVLWEHGTTSIGELGDRLQLDSGTISPLVKRLETAGIVERRRAPQDERSVLVVPTERGSAMADQARDIPGEVAASTGLGHDERVELRDTLMGLAQSLEGATPRSP